MVKKAVLHIGKYLQFTLEANSKKRKTNYWIVRNDKINLGFVAWQCQWRQYCFYPFKDTFFDDGCLINISRFCSIATKVQYLKGGMKRMEEEIHRIDEEFDWEKELSKPYVRNAVLDKKGNIAKLGKKKYI